MMDMNEFICINQVNSFITDDTLFKLANTLQDIINMKLINHILQTYTPDIFNQQQSYEFWCNELKNRSFNPKQQIDYISKRIKEILDQDLRDDFIIQTSAFDRDSEEQNTEFVKFVSLIIQYQVIENSSCESRIMNNAYESAQADLLRYFSGQEDKFEVDINRKKQDSVVSIGSSHSDLKQYEQETIITNLKEENSRLRTEQNHTFDELTQFKHLYESLKVQFDDKISANSNCSITEKNEIAFLKKAQDELKVAHDGLKKKYDSEKLKFDSERENFDEQINFLSQTQDRSYEQNERIKSLTEKNEEQRSKIKELEDKLSIKDQYMKEKNETSSTISLQEFESKTLQFRERESYLENLIKDKNNIIETKEEEILKKEFKITELTTKLGQTWKDQIDSNFIESADRLSQDELDINIDNIKIEMSGEAMSAEKKFENKLQETLDLLDQKNKTIFDLEVKIKDMHNSLKENHRNNKVDFDNQIESLNSKIREMQAEILNQNCKERFDQVWEKKMQQEQMKRREITNIANRVICNLVTRLKSNNNVSEQV